MARRYIRPHAQYGDRHEGSESAEHLLNILVLARSKEEGINNIATLGDYSEAPGEKFNYASTNLFVLSVALQNYVEEQEGSGVYYWDLVHENVLVPIGAEYFTLRQTLEPNGAQGIPMLAWGAMPTADEAAKSPCCSPMKENMKDNSY